MPNIFEKISKGKVKYSAFDLSHERKLSFKMGYLVPTLVQEIVPGDHFQVETETMLRLAPLLSPVMHRVNVFMHYFFVPNRLIWDEWEYFITGGEQGEALPEFPTAPLSNLVTFGADNTSVGSLADHLGLPTMDVGEIDYDPQVSLLPFRAYLKIWNEYYRDQNLTNPIPDSTINLKHMLRRCWEKDYFTSALPWAQRGDAAGIMMEPEYSQDGYTIAKTVGTNTPRGGMDNFYTDGGGLLSTQSGAGPNQATRLETEMQMGFTINEFRTANRLQRWLEKQARGGSRYAETILSHFDVRTSDARLQRPEFLGGGRQPIVISEVLNNTGTENAPQGDMAGHGLAMGTTNRFNRRFEEHGYVMGIMSVLPRTSYQQGISRHWTRTGKLDYYWPEFAHLGEQEVKEKELYYNQLSDSGEATFGYQQRYAEYKYAMSSVHGNFRNNLDFWHMSRIFTDSPLLNENFVTSDPTDRIFAVQDGTDNLWCQLYHSIKARRPMPYFSDPRL